MIPYKPYCWIEFNSASNAVLYFQVRIPSGSIIARDETVVPADDGALHRRTITFQIEGSEMREQGSGAENIEEHSHILSSATGYDPVYDDITVDIKKGNEKKGTSTTTHSEADASGDDDLL